MCYLTMKMSGSQSHITLKSPVKSRPKIVFEKRIHFLKKAQLFFLFVARRREGSGQMRQMSSGQIFSSHPLKKARPF